MVGANATSPSASRVEGVSDFGELPDEWLMFVFN